MTTLARSLLTSAARREAVARLIALLAATVAVSAVLLSVASPSGAMVKTLGGQKYGLFPHATKEKAFIPDLTGLEYLGGPVLHASSVYAIYWDPSVLRTGDPGRPGKYQGDWQKLINGFLQGVASESGTLGNVFALTGQYTEAGGARATYQTTFRGGYVDHASYPTDGCTDPNQTLNQNFACLTDAQLREQLASFVSANKWPAGKETIFYILTPPGVTVCIEANHCSDSLEREPGGNSTEETSYEQSFCSYHSTTTIGGEAASYAAIPWTAGTRGAGGTLPRSGGIGSDCQNGTDVLQEPEQNGLSPNGTYDHALPDVLINEIAAEQIATVTDPMLTGWIEPLHGYEVPDQCRNWFEEPPVVLGSPTPNKETEAGTLSNQNINGGLYYLNTEYNQAALYYAYPGLPCELHTNLAPSFTSPTPVNSGDVVAFDGNESDITLEQSADPTPSSQPYHRATFAWNFGDGTSVSGPGYSETNPSAPLYASVYHSYQYGGSYEVTLTVTDAAGRSTSTSHPLTVNGPAKPAPPAPTSGGSGAGSSTGSSTSSSTSASTPATQTATPTTSTTSTGVSVPPPLATAAIASRSLKSVLGSGGLVVRYTVNEQVAGHIEVMLASSIARKLKIGGPAATGLAPGTPPQVVIAKAILVTTKGGGSTVHIVFSKTTAARLRKLHKVSLMLRLSVRNAASHAPAATTVLVTATLAG